MKQSNLLIVGLISLSLIISLVTIITTSNQTDPEPTELIRTEVNVPAGLEVATLAGGCFWCTEAVLQETPGVVDVVSGYAGGQEVEPSYQQVYTHSTGHREAVQAFFDPEIISYEKLLDVFWRTIDPTDDGGQFVDRGFAYTTTIFYHDDEQKQIAETSKDNLESLPDFDTVVTPITEFTTFYRAEEYHQDFYLKSSERYERYENASGRDEFKELVWDEIREASHKD